MAERKESWVETYLKEQVEATGGEIRKVGWIGRMHAPDRFAFWPITREWLKAHRARPRGAWVETKRPGADARDGQKRERDRLEAAGYDARIIDSREAVDELISYYGLGEQEIPNG